jgi:hypothetical protein
MGDLHTSMAEQDVPTAQSSLRQHGLERFPVAPDASRCCEAAAQQQIAAGWEATGQRTG